MENLANVLRHKRNPQKPCNIQRDPPSGKANAANNSPLASSLQQKPPRTQRPSTNVCSCSSGYRNDINPRDDSAFEQAFAKAIDIVFRKTYLDEERLRLFR